MSNDNRTKHPLYSTWLTMRDRCNNPRNKRTNCKTPYISTRVRSGRTQYVVRVKDLRDHTGRTVYTRVRNIVAEAIEARDLLIEQMDKEGARG